MTKRFRSNLHKQPSIRSFVIEIDLDHVLAAANQLILTLSGTQGILRQWELGQTSDLTKLTAIDSANDAIHSFQETLRNIDKTLLNEWAATQCEIWMQQESYLNGQPKTTDASPKNTETN